MTNKREARAPLYRDAERGVVLIYAVVGLMLVAGIVVAGSMRGISSEETSRLGFEAEGLARQVAESGIVDGIAWLRKRPSQPVTEFLPARDMTQNPAINETDDVSRGLVREFEISHGYWGRYIVRLGEEAEPYNDGNGNGIFDPGEQFEDTNGDGRRSIAQGSRDVSALRGVPKAGTVWYLECDGAVFRRFDADMPLGQGRNARLAQTTISSEVRRLSITIPASAAIVIADADRAKIEGTRIDSPTLGVASREHRLKYKTKLNDEHRVEFDAPTPKAKVPVWVTSGVGTPSKNRIRIEDVFGVGIDTLKAMADYNVESLGGIGGMGAPVTDPVIEDVAGVLSYRMPYTIPDGAFVVITPPDGEELIFDKAQSLIGRGVVVVDGDLTITADTNTQFDGILYVTGKLHIDRSGVFRGTVIAGDELEVHGHLEVIDLPSMKVSRKTKKTKKTGKTRKSRSKKSNKVKSIKKIKSLKIIPEESVYFGHDPQLVDELVAELGRYRRWKSSYRPVPVAEDGRPDEHFRGAHRISSGN